MVDNVWNLLLGKLVEDESGIERVELQKVGGYVWFK